MSVWLLVTTVICTKIVELIDVDSGPMNNVLGRVPEFFTGRGIWGKGQYW